LTKWFAGAAPEDLLRLPDPDIKVFHYPEVAYHKFAWLERMLQQPKVTTVPIGVCATPDIHIQLGPVTRKDLEPLHPSAKNKHPRF
jgi:hypothetical protein